MKPLKFTFSCTLCKTQYTIDSQDTGYNYEKMPKNMGYCLTCQKKGLNKLPLIEIERIRKD